jgi:hypothetical protein
MGVKVPSSGRSFGLCVFALASGVCSSFGEKMTKTEREYYSRTVKKKVVALANSELYHLSRNLLK